MSLTTWRQRFFPLRQIQRLSYKNTGFCRLFSSTSNDLPDAVDVVVIGGGALGASTHYHLSSLGVRSLLLERAQLSSGTTWHSAGMLWRLRPSDIDVSLIARTRSLMQGELQERCGTDISPGWIENGGLFIAKDEERLNEYRRLQLLGKCFGIESHVLSPEDTRKLYPLLNVDDVIGSLYSPGDGTIEPSSLVSCLVKGAKLGQVMENTPVTSILTEATLNTCGHSRRRVAGVVTPHGTVRTRAVVTNSIPGARNMPNLRDHDLSIYVKQQGDTLCIGGYESNPILCDPLNSDFSFSLFDLNWDAFSPHLENSAHRIPAINDAGIKSEVCGPESFTPDHKPLMGETPELSGFFVGAGFNSAGIMFSGGCGEQLARWVVHGRPSIDMFSYDIRRFHSALSSSMKKVMNRSNEAYAKNYNVVWPFDQPLASRGLRVSPFHDQLIANGAFFQEVHSYERPSFFIKNCGACESLPFSYNEDYSDKEDCHYFTTLKDDYTFGYPSCHDLIGKEVSTCRNALAFFDLSALTKTRIHGANSREAVEWLCSAGVTSRDKIGTATYTTLCNVDGGIESDGVIVHDADDDFYLVTGAASTIHDTAWISTCLSDAGHTNVNVTPLTEDIAAFGVFGPEASKLLRRISPSTDFSNEAFPFSTSAFITIGNMRVRALRITYNGEYGIEFHIQKDKAHFFYDVITSEYHRAVQDGIVSGMSGILPFAGLRALDSLSLEKSFRHWHGDVRSDDTPLEAGLSFTCRWDKDFCGKESLVTQRERGICRYLICLTTSPSYRIVGHEPILQGDKAVGFVRRGGFSYTRNRSVAFGYIDLPQPFPLPSRKAERELMASVSARGPFFLEILGQQIPAELHSAPLYDPKGLCFKTAS